MSTASPPQALPYDVIDVTSWRPSHEEAMGSKAKMWLTSPEGELWLFKHVRGVEERAEDWPEKVASELAKVFGIPAAHVEFADRDGKRGVISLSITRGMDLVHGNELLFAQDPQYEKTKRAPEYGYNLAAVSAALADCSPPLDWPESEWTAADVFAGYLVFDALIANQDRHHENWGALIDLVKGVRALSPSFDHASSLGFMLTDEERRERLTTSDRGYSVHRWAERGKSHFEGRPSLVDLAAEALRECSAAALQYWLSQIRMLESSVWETILGRVPRERASVPTCNFAAEVIATNRGRLLDACSGFGP
jgi:hypothetical protein